MILPASTGDSPTAPSESVSPVRSLGLSFAASAAIQAMNVLTGVLLARALGPEGRGELTTVLLWPALLATIGSLGVAQASTFYAARSAAPVEAMAGTAAALAFAETLLLECIGIPAVYFISQHLDAPVRTAAFIYLGVIPLNLLALSALGILNGLQRYVAYQSLRALVILMTTVQLAALAAFATVTVTRAAIAYLVADFVTLTVAVLLLRRELHSRPRFDRRLVRRLLGFGIKSHLSSVSSIFNERLDQLLISLFFEPFRLGLYVVAVTLTSAVTLIGTSVENVALPLIARRKTLLEQQEGARAFAGVTLMLSVGISVPMIILAPTLIQFFFGRSFLGATDVSRILLVAAVVLSTNRALAAILKAVDRPLDAGLAEGAALVATIGGLSVMLPAFGLVGAGLASALAYGVSMIWMVRGVGRALRLEPRAIFIPEARQVRRMLSLIKWSPRGGR